MKSQNYLYTFDESAGDLTSYEEQLLLHYDDYLEGGASSLTASNHYNLELGELEEDLEDDFESEYDENDWEEEDSEDDRKEESDEEPGTFIMMS
ncbi:hypothetical protein [Flavobacterium sp. ENC]|uniref:hypothetical protein n=1 Tax=Flavobacterium sp. ENC TaxID=2897330 RepID=UPI001E44E990|nr:hypothetical protein [Flavobacterium sp. ENC]MCD0465178.1 hypothetical protein [Flavobacterium sp. ENC]